MFFIEVFIENKICLKIYKTVKIDKKFDLEADNSLSGAIIPVMMMSFEKYYYFF
jgi:hypothetical protein